MVTRFCKSKATGKRVKMLKKRTKSGKGKCPKGATLVTRRSKRR